MRADQSSSVPSCSQEVVIEELEFLALLLVLSAPADSNVRHNGVYVKKFHF